MISIAEPKDIKTIKEISHDLNITVTRIYPVIKNYLADDLKEHIFTKNGIRYIDKTGQEILTSYFSSSEKFVAISNNKIYSTLQEMLVLLKEIKETLNTQTKHDGELEKLGKSINTISNMLDAEPNPNPKEKNTINNPKKNSADSQNKNTSNDSPDKNEPSEKHKQILEMLLQKKSYRHIAKELKTSNQTIIKVRDLYLKEEEDI